MDIVGPYSFFKMDMLPPTAATGEQAAVAAAAAAAAGVDNGDGDGAHDGDGGASDGSDVDVDGDGDNDGDDEDGGNCHSDDDVNPNVAKVVAIEEEEEEEEGEEYSVPDAEIYSYNTKTHMYNVGLPVRYGGKPRNGTLKHADELPVELVELYHLEVEAAKAKRNGKRITRTPLHHDELIALARPKKRRRWWTKVTVTVRVGPRRRRRRKARTARWIRCMPRTTRRTKRKKMTRWRSSTRWWGSATWWAPWDSTQPITRITYTRRKYQKK